MEEHWNYGKPAVECGDSRKFVTLLDAGMVWVGIRAWHGVEGRWYNGNEPERAQVLAWQDMPPPAIKRWVRGNLT